MVIDKNKEIDKIKKRIKRESEIKPITQKDKKLFSRIRNAVKKQK